MARIGLITCAQFRDMATDDDLVANRLNARGHAADRPNWDDSGVNWSDYDALVIRSPWDYQWRRDEFLAWVDRVDAANVPLFNPPAVLRWNSNKSYLRELHSKGVQIPPTMWLNAGEDWSLGRVMDAHGWQRAVVKPMIGAGAFHTYAVDRDQADVHEANTAAEVRSRGTLVQEFLPEIVRDGEWSLLFFGGEFSHAIVKRPKTGDFRVQEHLGGTYERARADEGIVAQARDILRHAPGELLYARVDGIARGGRFLLVELEVFEPWFYLAYSDHGTERFIAALEARIKRP